MQDHMVEKMRGREFEEWRSEGAAKQQIQLDISLTLVTIEFFLFNVCVLICEECMSEMNGLYDHFPLQ